MVKNKKYGIIIAVFAVLVLAVMVMIFLFSAETGAQSTKTSNGVTKLIIKIIKPDFDSLPKEERAEYFSKAAHYIRKIAHFSEYFLLGLFSSLLLVSVFRAINKKPGIFVVIPPVFCFLYAIFDEGHQHFVGGRAAQFTDVLIDTSGALLATLFVFIFYYLIRSAKEKGTIGSRQ